MLLKALMVTERHGWSKKMYLMAPSDDISDNHGGVNQVVNPQSIYYHRHSYRKIEEIDER